jgi:hypothetical protein
VFDFQAQEPLYKALHEMAQQKSKSEPAAQPDPVPKEPEPKVLATNVPEQAATKAPAKTKSTGKRSKNTKAA